MHYLIKDNTKDTTDKAKVLLSFSIALAKKETI